MFSIARTLWLILSFPGAVTGAPPLPPPAHIVLIRHAEKPLDINDPHLSPAGVKRAEHLVSFVASDPAMTALGPPVAIFATQTTRDDDGQRTQETVAPLAKSLRLQVQTPFHGKDFALLARQILTDPAFSGKTVFICWNHEDLPQLVAALGVMPEPPKWKAAVFDRVYIISYSRKGKAILTMTRYTSN